jgi:hypothetical protein
MKELTKKDPLTGEEFIPKRVNQRFASASNRKKFNNQQANQLRKKRAIIYRPLNKNHLLLMKLMKGIDESVFTYDYLEGYGIQYNSYSHIKEVEGAKHFFVFEFALIIDKTKRTVKIKKHGRY